MNERAKAEEREAKRNENKISTSVGDISNITDIGGGLNGLDL
jgi:hypothetical protein